MTGTIPRIPIAIAALLLYAAGFAMPAFAAESVPAEQQQTAQPPEAQQQQIAEQPPKCEEYNYVQALALAERLPEQIFREAACFSKLPDAIKIFVTAARENPAAAFSNIEEYAGAEWAEEVADTAAAGVPETAFRTFKQYREAPAADAKKKKTLEVLKKSLKDAAFAAIKNEDYWTVLAFADLYIDEPWAKDAVIGAGKKDLRTFLTYKKVEEAGWFKKFLREVVFAAIDESPAVVLESADSFLEEAWAKEALTVSADRDPESAFRYFKIYSKKEWSRPLLEKVSFPAAEKNAWVVLENAPLYAVLSSDSWLWKIFPERRDDRVYRRLLQEKLQQEKQEGDTQQIDLREVDFLYIRDLLERGVLKYNHDFLNTSARDFFLKLFSTDQETADIKMIFVLDGMRGSSRFNKLTTSAVILDLWISARAPQAIREIINLEGRSDEHRLAVIRDWSPQLMYESIVNYSGKIPKPVFELVYNGGKYLGAERKNTLFPKILTRYKNKGREFSQLLAHADPQGKHVGVFLRVFAEQGKLGDLLKEFPDKEDRRKLFSGRISKEVRWELLKFVDKDERQALMGGLVEGEEKQKLLEMLK